MPREHEDAGSAATYQCDGGLVTFGICCRVLTRQLVCAQVARISEAAEEVGGLRLAHPRLASVSVERAAEEGNASATLRLGFLNLAAQAKFSAELQLGEALCPLVIFPLRTSVCIVHACWQIDSCSGPKHARGRCIGKCCCMHAAADRTNLRLP